MTRREAIRWLALRLAGIVAAGGAGAWIVAIAPWRAPPPLGRRAQRPGGTPGRPAPSAASGVQRFVSRPDLRPPVVTIHVPADPSVAPGLIVTDCHLGPAQYGPLIFDGKGDLVWFLPASPRASATHIATNVQVQEFRGRPVLTWFQGALVHGHGVGHYVLYDTAYRPVAQVHAANGFHGDLHEFVLTDRGTALFTCYGEGRGDLSPYGGKANGAYYYGVVQEVDPSSGRLLFEWRSHDHVGFGESYMPIGHATTPWDYFHVNSVAVDPIDDNLIVSARNTWAIYKVDRRSGRVLWRLGGKASDFPIGRDAHFAFQHDARRWPDGLVTIFDDEAGPPAEASQSRAIVLALDEAKRTARLVAQYRHAPPTLADSQGSVQFLSDNHRFVGWGAANHFTEFDRAGRVLFDARLAPKTQSYRAFKQVWTGTPAAPPAMAVRAGKARVTVYASWNGATGVERWAVLGGSTASALKPLASAPRAGFETVVRVPGRPAYLAVQALDGTGRELGRSPTRALAALSGA